MEVRRPQTPFLFRDAAGGLFGQSLTAVDVREHGALVIDFHDGAGLWIGPDPQFESWHLTGRGVDPITVGPGGEDDWEL
ncbi:DUF6188 family protein [Streptomyces sp. CA-106131]|uniref:DUF6188 family protein n=1 Tax=Streptomyces sp. CA-106131 TaxID=3240045 RepID=UPI003D8E01C1